METYKTNATLGVGKLIYTVASGIKQKNIQDTLYLEEFLGLDDIKPMQTSYTQSAEDRNSGDDEDKDKTEKVDEEVENKTETEPSENKTDDQETIKEEK